MILTSSGTSVLEASMLNIVNPDDHFVVIVSGAFGNRFKQILRHTIKMYTYIMWNGDNPLILKNS